MARNRVQFQKGMSLAAFLERYGDEQSCYQALYRLRWPDGFRCPDCGHRRHCQLQARRLLQCNHCHHQTSITAQTVLAGTKLPLRIWFLAMYLLTQSKTDLSAMALKRHLGVSYNTAWLIKQKLMQTMRERDDQQPLDGWVQLDDAYWGGECRGRTRGRGSTNKTPFVAAVACTANDQPTFIKLTPLKAFSHDSIRLWSQQHLRPECRVTSDGLHSFRILSERTHHTRILTGSGAISVETPELKWVNTVLGNIKTAMRGTYHAVRPQHLGRYLAAFSWRFNRRYALDQLVDRLAKAACRTPPLPYRLATLAEVPT